MKRQTSISSCIGVVEEDVAQRIEEAHCQTGNQVIKSGEVDEQRKPVNSKRV